MEKTRRDFIKSAAVGVTTAATFSIIPSSVMGANDRLRVAMMGTNSRGFALTQEFAKAKNCQVTFICDVDSRVIDKTVAKVDEMTGKKPKGVTDFRRALDDKDVDILVIAAPDFWHAPATILGLKAGKNVYVEKPVGHNPREGELVVKAQKKYGKVVQMGNQQRSSDHTIRAIKKVHEGELGRAYFAKTWYANTRGPIGTGKAAPVPEWLDYELWQGPAPRVPFKDNVVHYNWHWFWRWGTGESCNNATHEIDVARWALEVDYPTRVTSVGGRYHFNDDWEFFDTQDMGFQFPGRKTIVWEGRSCNGQNIHGRDRGTAVHCEGGTLIVDRNGYEIYDNKNKLVDEFKSGEKISTTDISSAGGSLNGAHVSNFLGAIREGTRQNSPIDDGHKSVLLCHLGNIAQKLERDLEIDPENGRIQSDSEAQKMWGRDYEPGWEPTL